MFNKRGQVRVPVVGGRNELARFFWWLGIFVLIIILENELLGELAQLGGVIIVGSFFLVTGLIYVFRKGGFNKFYGIVCLILGFASAIFVFEPFISLLPFGDLAIPIFDNYFVGVMQWPRYVIMGILLLYIFFRKNKIASLQMGI